MFNYTTQISRALLVLISSLLGVNQVRSDVFLIGNSLTWDSRPMHLDERADWHIRTGRNLQYMYENKYDVTAPGSVSWATLRDNPLKYSKLVVQPHFGSRLGQDVRFISNLMQKQTSATTYIHTGWTRHYETRADYELGNVDDMMRHTPQYFRDLVTELRTLHPGRKIRITQHINVQYEMLNDIEANAAPIKDFSDLFRDTIHMTQFEGRYLAHNLLRQAMGEPISTNGFVDSKGVLKFSEARKAYFDSKILALGSGEASRSFMRSPGFSAVPEPNSLLALGSVCIIALMRRKRREAKLSQQAN